MEQNPAQQEQQNNNRRRPVESAAAERQNNHPPSQACPRCNSTNTKFCYYNNYSLSQPRFFCKGCRRYWTHGGTLRNVPVGGGCRKSKRPKLSSSSSSASATATVTATVTATATTSNPHPPQDSTTINPAAAVINSPFYGGGCGGFLSSLAAIQPISFGPNFGMLHGLGFPGFENHQQQQQEFSFQQLLQQRHNLYHSTEMGASSSENWNLLFTNNDSNDDDNHNNDNNPSKWTDHFPAGSGLDDP